MPARALALLLADGRFPCGGHAHSGGLEAAVEAGRVSDVSALAAFLQGRLMTAGRVGAAFAAAATEQTGPQAGGRLDAELDARTASPALRRASRQQGRALVRAARAAFGERIPTWLHGSGRENPPVSGGFPRPEGWHQAVVLGAVAAGLELEPAEAAAIAAHGAVAGSATAAVRLLGLDPLAVAAVVANLADGMEEVVAEAVDGAAGDPAGLPCPAAPLLDIGAELHAVQEVRLFAS